jgi:hypothetical protein
VSIGLSVAAAQGLRCDDPVVLRDAWHVLVHLRPLPIVARVSTSLQLPGGPSEVDLVRELAVASHAARAGAPVVPPTDEIDPGPHRSGGHTVTFWRYVEPAALPDPRDAGRGLRSIHDALADYDGPLPAAGHPGDTEAMLAALGSTAEVDLMRDALSRNEAVDGQALHGDAHLMNCLGSASGPLWHDFETACRGPREYDLAALVSHQRVIGDVPESTEALDAYGAHDAALVEAMLPVYIVWVTASMLLALPRRPALRQAIDARLRWLSVR